MATAFRFDLVGRPVLTLVGAPLSGLSRPAVSAESVFRIGPFVDPLHESAHVVFGLFVDETQLEVFTNDHLLQIRVAAMDAWDPSWRPPVVGAAFATDADPVGGIVVDGPTNLVAFVETTGIDPVTKKEIVALSPPAAVIASGTKIRPVDGETAASGLYPITFDAGNGVKQDIQVYKRTAVLRIKQKEFVTLAQKLDAGRRLRQMVVATYALDPETGLVSATSLFTVVPA